MNAPAITPISVTQATCELALGVTALVFKRTIKRLNIPHTRSGKSILVLVDDWRDALRKHATTAAAIEAVANDTPTEDDAMRLLNFRRVAK